MHHVCSLRPVRRFFVGVLLCAPLGCPGDDSEETADTGTTTVGSGVTAETSPVTTGEVVPTEPWPSSASTGEPTTGDDPSTSADPTADPTTGSADTCTVPARAFVGLGADGRQFYDLPGRPPNGMTVLRWAFAAPQIGIEVSEVGDLYAVEPTADGWVLARYCYNDGAVLDSVQLDLPIDRAITSFTWHAQEIAVAVAAAAPDTGAALHAFMPDGTLTELEALTCPGEETVFPIADYNPADENVLAFADQGDQYVRTGDIFCANYTGDYLDLGDGPEWFQWMDFDVASYDDFFEVTYDLYGLSPYGRLFVRGVYDASDPALVSEFPEHLRAFAIGPN